jgi:hypothetical protein
MVIRWQTSLVSRAALVFCAAGLLNTTFARPPVRLPIGNGPISNPMRDLDLRPPAVPFDAAAKQASAFPSSAHGQWLTGIDRDARAENPDGREQSRLPGLRTETSTPRLTGGVAGFAQRVHREGLPIARLWENKSALVSLGLNPRGKPGLWIIQKIR